MKSIKSWLGILVFSLLLVGSGAIQSPAADADRHDVLYTCACGPSCNCNTVSTKPGKCACDKELKWGHVLKIEGNEAILCQCGEGCQCGGLDAKDPSKCVCGNPVKRVSLEGTGIYFCNCGASCFCNTVSDQPGKCRCGMDLKKEEKTQG